MQAPCASELNEPTTIFLQQPKRVALAYRTLPEVVRSIVIRCDGRRTFKMLCDEGPLSADDTARVLLKLEQLGLITSCDALPDPPEAQVEAVFSADEEAFFSQDIDHLAQREPERRQSFLSFL